MRPSIFIRVSVGPSVRPSVTPVQKPRFSAVFGQGEILYRIKWSTNMFWESPLLLSRFIWQFVRLTLHSCHMFITRRDTVWTHRCPIGLVFWPTKSCFSAGPLYRRNCLLLFCVGVCRSGSRAETEIRRKGEKNESFFFFSPEAIVLGVWTFSISGSQWTNRCCGVAT